MPPGTYRNVNGTTALSLGLIAASVRSGLPLVLASYPITPASELLHELSRHARIGVSTIQAEDEIAAAGMALGASFGGRLGVTATSGPGMDLKAETIGLAVMLELPLIVIDVQRAGPVDRNADQDRAVRPADGAARPPRREPAAGDRAEHRRRLLRGRVRGRPDRDPLPDAGDPPLRHVPGLLLGAVADPDVATLPAIDPAFATAPPDGDRRLQPYSRDERLARPWAMPGHAGAGSTGSAGWRRPMAAATSPTTAPTTSG